MHNVLNVYKPIGKTPLEMILAVKKRFPEYEKVPMTYAGRLDPLAHGILLLLTKDAIKKKAQFLAMTKTYRFEVVFGLDTDTYDVLGILTKTCDNLSGSFDKSFVNNFVNTYTGKQTISYPPFSSKTVAGRPLFQWAKEGKLNEITLPTQDITIEDFSVLSFGTIDQATLHKKIVKHISLVNGDFRQEAITTQWNAYFSKLHPPFQTATFQLSCSSGTYVRGIVHDLGNAVQKGAVALDILRTHVGDYTEDKALRII